MYGSRTEPAEFKPAALDSEFSLGCLKAVPARESSLERLCAAISCSIDYFARTQPGQNPERIAADLLADSLADSSRRLFVLEDAKGGPLGLVELALDTPEPLDATIVLLVIDEKKRGLGFGREIASTLFARLASEGFACAHLGVAKGENRAANFWSSLGMWQTGEVDGVRIFELTLASAHGVESDSGAS